MATIKTQDHRTSLVLDTNPINYYQLDMYKVFDVKCKSCKGQNRVGIDEDNNSVNWISLDPIISARFRFDRNWGWQCRCGANDLLTPEEDRFWQNKSVHPRQQELAEIMKNLKEYKPKFEMVGV